MIQDRKAITKAQLHGESRKPLRIIRLMASQGGERLALGKPAQDSGVAGRRLHGWPALRTDGDESSSRSVNSS